MSKNSFYQNKIEEALQLLSANNELIEKQNSMLEEFLVRFANMQAEHNLNAFLQDAKQDGKIVTF